MGKKFWIALCLVVPAAIGCSTSRYLVDKPMILYPLGGVMQADADAQGQSLQALLRAFSDNKWEIHRVDNAGGIIEAEACQRLEHCAEVQATVKADGSIEILRTPGQKLNANEEVQLKRWLLRLKKSYDKHLRTKG